MINTKLANDPQTLQKLPYLVRLLSFSVLCLMLPKAFQVPAISVFVHIPRPRRYEVFKIIRNRNHIKVFFQDGRGCLPAPVCDLLAPIIQTAALSAGVPGQVQEPHPLPASRTPEENQAPRCILHRRDRQRDFLLYQQDPVPVPLKRDTSAKLHAERAAPHNVKAVNPLSLFNLIMRFVHSRAAVLRNSAFCQSAPPSLFSSSVLGNVEQLCSAFPIPNVTVQLPALRFSDTEIQRGTFHGRQHTACFQSRILQN